MSKQLLKSFKKTNRPSNSNHAKQNDTKTACTEVPASGVARKSMHAAAQKIWNTLIHSVCNVGKRSNRLINVMSNLQLSTYANHEGLWRVSRANPNFPVEITSQIEPALIDACRKTDRTSIDNTDFLHTSSKVTQSHHYVYTNENSNICSTIVEGGHERANLLPTPPPQAQEHLNATATAPNCSNAENDMVLERYAKILLIQQMLLEVESNW